MKKQKNNRVNHELRTLQALAIISKKILKDNKLTPNQLLYAITGETQDISEEFLSSKTTAKKLGVSVKTLANWRTNGIPNLPFHKFGSRVHYSSTDIINFASTRRFLSTSELVQLSTAKHAAKVSAETRKEQ